jgi:long-subunit fatty acid transport protein
MASRSALRAAALLGASWVALAPWASRALNPETIFLSPEAALAGGAVLAADDEGGAGWYNPASLGALRRSSLQLGASAYSFQTFEVERSITTVLPWGTIDGNARDTGYSSVPSVLALSYLLRDGLGLSLGIWTPYHGGTAAELRVVSSGPYPGQPGLGVTYDQTYAWTERSDDTWVGMAVGWRAHPRLRVGGALQVAYTTSTTVVDLSTSLDTTSLDPLEQGSHVNVSVRGDQTSLAGRALLGLQWDATTSLRLAVNLRSPSVRGPVWGGATRLLSASALLPGYPPQVEQLTEQVTPVEGPSIVEPGRLSAGLSWRRGRWRTGLDGEWSPPLDRTTGGAPESWNLRVGVLYLWSDDLLLGGGLFREGAKQLASQGRLQLDTYGFTAGVSYRPEKVIRTLGGGQDWDLLTGLAVRGAYATGLGPGMVMQPFDLSRSALPIQFDSPERAFQEVPARSMEGSLHVFTSLQF